MRKANRALGRTDQAAARGQDDASDEHGDVPPGSMRERLQELADGSAEIGRRFAAEADTAARTTLTEVERRPRTLAEAFARPTAR